MRCLILHLDAPLMSFGGVLVDNRGPTEAWPGASMLTGLLGNALGWHHRDTDALQRLQERLVHAARLDRAGERTRDYHTVDLGQAHMVGTGWTTWGKEEKRAGGEAADGTHIRLRDYWAERVMTVALSLRPAEERPTLEELAEALRRPARPLFLGRKTCLPSRPLLGGWGEAEDIAEAALRAPWPRGVPRPPQVQLWAPTDQPTEDGHTVLGRDLRDWGSQLHTGRRLIRHTFHAFAETGHG